MNLYNSIVTVFFLFVFACKASSAEPSGGKPSAAETYYVKGTVKGLSQKKIYLASVHGDDLKKIDSVVCDSGGNFQMQIAGNMPIGIYKLLLGRTYKPDLTSSEENNIDLIFNYANIKFNTTFGYVIDSLRVIESDENRLYYDFFRTMKHQYQDRLEILSQTLRFYPHTDGFYDEIEKHFQKVLAEQQKYVSGFLEKNANTVAARIIKIQQKPSFFKFVEATQKMTDLERSEYIKAHFLDDVDFTDTIILRTSLLPDKIMSFMSLFYDKQRTSVQQAQEYKKATDVVASKVKVNDAVNNYVLVYLTKGFEKVGMEEVVLYITDKYLATSCKNDELKDDYSIKAEKMKKLAIGQPAPGIEMNDINGKPVKLSEINTDYMLVLFWSSWCPHCTTVLPPVKVVYESINSGLAHKKLEVLAYSIDTDSTLWKKFINDGNYNWINCSELKGWGSKVAKDYNVTGTPTMLLLDKQKKIIAKPMTASELENELRK